MRKKDRYQEFGKCNQVMLSEEKIIISNVEKAIHGTPNAAIIGSNGEKPLIDFFNRYFPKVFSVETGYFITKKGNRSPQVDILVLDSRFPILCRNVDNSVLAMTESVIACISVKTGIQRREIKNINNWSEKINTISKNIFPANCWKQIAIDAIGYKTNQTVKGLSHNYFNESKNNKEIADLCLLRASENKQNELNPFGYHLWWERLKLPITVKTISPLSDFFYRLLQETYHILDERNYNNRHIHNFLNDYFKWGSQKHWIACQQ